MQFCLQGNILASNIKEILIDDSFAQNSGFELQKLSIVSFSAISLWSMEANVNILRHS